MSVDLRSETLMGLPQAACRVPSGRQDRPVNPSTIWRWIHEGVSLPDGQVIRLEAIRLGGRWLTSLEALQRFADAQTPDLSERPAATPGSKVRP